MKYRHALRNWLIVIGGASLVAGRVMHLVHAADAVAVPLAAAGFLAVVVGVVLGRVMYARYARAVARDRRVWGWKEGSTPRWAVYAKAFPLEAVGPVELDDILYGNFRGFWVNALTSSVKQKVRTLNAAQSFQVIGLPVAEWVPRAQILPVGKMRSAYQLIGGRTVNFESAAFNAVWHVSGDDARSVHDLVHPRTMERLLQPDARDVPIIISGGAIWTWRAKFVHGRDLERIVGVLHDFAMGVPSHLDSAGHGVLVPRRSESMSADVDRVNAARPPKGPVVSRG